MAKIKNLTYRKFLDKDKLFLINQRHIKSALSRVKGKFKREGRALIIVCYVTGGCPSEILQLRSSSINRNSEYIAIDFPGTTRTLKRKVIINTNQIKLSLELYNYSKSLFDDCLLFPNFISSYSRTVKGVEYIETTDKMRYYFNKWFKDVVPGSITPQILRHNLFLKMMINGAREGQVKHIKGGKSLHSIKAYTHLQKNISLNSAKYIK